MSDDWDIEEELTPLKMTCTSSKCQERLHCYKPTRAQKESNEIGQCRSCNESADFDWERLHRMDINDIDYTVAALKNEFIRHHYWTNNIPTKVENYALRKGKVGMQKAFEHRVRKYLGEPANAYDGRQTPVEDSPRVNAVNFAQHATASCCRICAEYWFGIPKDRSLREDEISYLTQLGMRYVGERFPILQEKGEKVSPLRKTQENEYHSTEETTHISRI
ncbi:DUF4186 family protein [Leptolyngbya sp. CCNP1308]|uniref:DUF4186 family protein n=1 Tax=Leptolyngbya sp. CCNP1308 TaxID=3110255 RepID=UPI002B217F2E|nr:DUF4186 family protein [Leptolyngbya sp. CCNP1308]MEA5448460.1 DUF4186 family protein [Leptolyngbya sp. CCNP1308]